MCPERTVEGEALSEMRRLPQIIGGLNSFASESAQRFFSNICDEIVLVNSLEAAELTKLVNNTYRDLMFAFANEVALISNSYSISASEVIRAANYNYPRSNLAFPGPSGGPCLEKDPWILAESGEMVGLDLKITKASRMMNETFVSIYLKEKIKFSTEFKKVAILGLAFKGNPPSTDTRGSLTPILVNELSTLLPNSDFVGFDASGEINEYVDLLDEVKTLDSALRDADVVIIANNSNKFHSIEDKIKVWSMPDVQVIDFWGFLEQRNLGENQVLCSWAGQSD
jgi:nucleotide sugar dehydrogenase